MATYVMSFINKALDLRSEARGFSVLFSKEAHRTIFPTNYTTPIYTLLQHSTFFNRSVETSVIHVIVNMTFKCAPLSSSLDLRRLLVDLRRLLIDLRRLLIDLRRLLIDLKRILIDLRRLLIDLRRLLIDFKRLLIDFKRLLINLRRLLIDLRRLLIDLRRLLFDLRFEKTID